MNDKEKENYMYVFMYMGICIYTAWSSAQSGQPVVLMLKISHIMQITVDKCAVIIAGEIRKK